MYWWQHAFQVREVPMLSFFHIRAYLLVLFSNEINSSTWPEYEFLVLLNFNDKWYWILTKCFWYVNDKWYWILTKCLWNFLWWSFLSVRPRSVSIRSTALLRERTELQWEVLEQAKRCSADPRISTSRRIAEWGLNIDDLVQHTGLLFFDVLRTAKSEF